MSNQAMLDNNFLPCVGVGQWHTIVITEGSKLLGMGSNKLGQLGTNKLEGDLSHQKIPDPKGNGKKVWSDPPKMVSCGNSHSMVLLMSGEIFAFGFADSGRLGMTNQEKFVAQPSMIPFFKGKKPVTYVACGADHTLCINSAGEVFSWGVGSYGNLGHGANRDEYEPRQIDALRGMMVRMVAGGAKHSACVTAKGELYTWGHGDKGRLGNGAQRGTSTPELIQSIAHCFISSVECGESHSACISDSGELFTWGAGSFGRLGHGEESDVFEPTKVEGLNRYVVQQVSLGVFHSVAVTKDGLLFTWGGGQYGNLGLGTSGKALIPTQVPSASFSGSPILQAFAGSSSTVAVSRNGSLFTWGEGVHGELGHGGSKTQCLKPEKVRALESGGIDIRVHPLDISLLSSSSDTMNGLTNYGAQLRRSTINAIKMISVGSKHSMALAFSGILFTWGGNDFGQVGNGTRDEVRTPIKVKLNQNFQSRIEYIAAGAHHSLCCISQGDVYVWGKGEDGQLGTGSTIVESMPIVLQGLQGTRVIKVYASHTHSAAISDEGKLFTWGDSDMGKLGHGRSLIEVDTNQDTISLPRTVKGELTARRVVSVSLGTDHSGCIDDTGTAFTWGGGWQGKLGHGGTENEYLPQPVLALRLLKCKDISCGAYHTMFVTEDGDLYVCGRGDARLGLGDTDDQLIPILNTALRAETDDAVIKAYAAEEHSMVLTNKGRVWVWGKDTYGKLGLGESHSRGDKPGNTQIISIPQMIDTDSLFLESVPEQASQEDDIRSLAASSNHCLALTQSSFVYGWGFNGSSRIRSTRQFPEMNIPVPTKLSISFSRTGDVGGDSLGVMTSNSILFSSAIPAGEEVAGAATAMAIASKQDALSSAQVALNAAANQTGGDDSLAALGIATIEGFRTLYQGDIEGHVRSYMESGKVPPLYVVQLFLKSEPREAQGIADAQNDLVAGEEELFARLNEIVSKERKLHVLDYEIGLTIASVVKFLNMPGASEGRKQSVNAKTIRRMGIGSKESIIAILPDYELIAKFFLTNPKYMLGLYKRYVVKDNASLEKGSSPTGFSWKAIYFELVESLYMLQDPHCEHLCIKLAELILQQEITEATKPRRPVRSEEIPLTMLGSDGEEANLQGQQGSFKHFLEPRMQCESFLRVASILSSQPHVNEFMSDHFGKIMFDWFIKQNSQGYGREQDSEKAPSLDVREIARDLQSSRFAAGQVNVKSGINQHSPESRLRQLEGDASTFFNKILEVAEKLPDVIRLLCKVLHQELKRTFEKDPSADFDKAIGKFLVDHFFSPVFKLPASRNVLRKNVGEMSKQMQKNMESIVDVLQRMFTGRTFREESLEPLNKQIRNYSSKVGPMVRAVLKTPNHLSDMLYFDIFAEYLRPKENNLRVLLTNRSIEFIRYAFWNNNKERFCDGFDPLNIALEGSNNKRKLRILEGSGEVEAEKFCFTIGQSVDASHKVCLNVDLRCLLLDANSVQAASDLKASIRKDPGSDTPVPVHMFENAAPVKDTSSEVAITLRQVDLKRGGEDSHGLVEDKNTTSNTAPNEEVVKALEKQLIELGDFSPSASINELHAALDRKQKRCASENDFSTAQEVYNLRSSLHEVDPAQESKKFQNLLVLCLTNLIDRKETTTSLALHRRSIQALATTAKERLDELDLQRLELEGFFNNLLGMKSEGDPSSSNLHGASLQRRKGSVFQKSQGGVLVMKQSLQTLNAKTGAYGSFTLKQLIEKRIAHLKAEQLEHKHGDVSMSREGGSFSSLPTPGLAESKRDMFNFLRKNRANITFVFTSSTTGLFLVTVVHMKETLLDHFEIDLSRLEDRGLKSTTQVEPSTLPLTFSATALKQMLEELTMKHIVDKNMV